MRKIIFTGQEQSLKSNALINFAKESNVFHSYPGLDWDLLVANVGTNKNDAGGLRYPEKIARIEPLLKPLQKRLGY